MFLGSLRARTILVVLMVGLTAGCDGFDASDLTSMISESDATAVFAKAAKYAQDRDPEMQSIGPKGSQRIYYQFVDDGGRVQFVERLGDVPEAWRDRVGFVEMSQPPPLTPIEARRSWNLSAGRTAEILSASASPTSRSGRGQDAKVLLYSAQWCGYCTKARAHLDRSGVDYELLDVDIEAVARELRDKTGRGGIPVLDYSGEILRGYSADKYEQAVRSIQG
jgi:glutaredoxin